MSPQPKEFYKIIWGKQVFKANPPLLIIIGCCVGGVAWTTTHLTHLAVHSPDVHWVGSRGDGELPSTKWPINKQSRYRFFDAKSSEEYAKMKFPEERPDIDNLWRKYLRTKAPVK